MVSQEVSPHALLARLGWGAGDERSLITSRLTVEFRWAPPETGAHQSKLVALLLQLEPHFLHLYLIESLCS